MKDILIKSFGFLKYVFLIIAFGIVLYGIIVTYSRLEKPITEAYDVFLPFALVLLVFIVSLFVNIKASTSKLLLNFVSCAVFIVTIVIGLRSIFDKYMLLYHKYQINFNPTFFSDNLSAIEIMLYMVFVSNVLLIIVGLLNKDKKVSLNNIQK